MPYTCNSCIIWDFLMQHDPMTSHYSNPPPFYVGGFGAPPIPYGVSNRYGSPIPPSGVPYNYVAPLGAPGAYGHIPAFPPGGFRGGLSFCLPLCV